MKSSAAPPRRPGFRVLAVALAALCALAAAEVAVRFTAAGLYAPRISEYQLGRPAGSAVWQFDPAKPPPEHIWDRDPYGRLPPGARMSYEINAAGLRGPLPPPGRDTVLVLGDSFTFGEGVPFEQTFVSRIERTLATRERSAPAQALVNAGIPGYGTEQELARLPEWLDRFRPRAVVVVFLMNDVMPDGETPLANDRRRGADDGQDDPGSGLALWRLLRSVGDRARNDRALEDWYVSFYFGENQRRWDETRPRLTAMRDLAAAKGARFGVVLFPIIHRLAENPFAAVHAEIGHACRASGIPFLDLTPALAVESDQALWVHPTDHHPDARAHELAADAMAPFVAGLLR
ncbi:MAG: hypothetical protein K8T90_17490 [Planctomycetes bacterium]|nr:hypothetical protein [Planctomycetota bacterium]